METAPSTRAQPAAPAEADRLAFVDSIRAVAVLLVFGFHLLLESFGGLPPMEAKLTLMDGNTRHLLLSLLPFSYGCIGVPIFFVVSGFCIHLAHRRSRETGYRTFFIRRFFRIYPPYFAALCFFAFVLPTTRIALDSPINFAQFFSHVLMVHNLDHRSFLGINGTFWTLGVEVQLYLIYPVLLWLTRRIGWEKALWLTAAIELPLRAASLWMPWPYFIGGSPFYHWMSWSLGAKLAEDYLEGKRPTLAWCPWWIFPALAAFLYHSRTAMVFIFPCIALATTVVMARILARRPNVASQPVRAGWFTKALRHIGMISYSVYLLHGPPLGYLKHHLIAAFPGVHFTPLAMAGLLLAGSIVLLAGCELFYRWVEAPSANLGKQIVKKIAARQPSIG